MIQNSKSVCVQRIVKLVGLCEEVKQGIKHLRKSVRSANPKDHILMDQYLYYVFSTSSSLYTTLYFATYAVKISVW